MGRGKVTVPAVCTFWMEWVVPGVGMAALAERRRGHSEFISGVVSDEGVAESLAVIIVAHNIYSS